MVDGQLRLQIANRLSHIYFLPFELKFSRFLALELNVLSNRLVFKLRGRLFDKYRSCVLYPTLAFSGISFRQVYVNYLFMTN